MYEAILTQQSSVHHLPRLTCMKVFLSRDGYYVCYNQKLACCDSFGKAMELEELNIWPEWMAHEMEKQNIAGNFKTLKGIPQTRRICSCALE